MSYVLENQDENDRLEYQAKQRNYLPEEDFSDEELCLNDNTILLDAGCGSGVVSRLFAKRNKNKQIEIIAVDNCSKERLDDAQKRAVKEGLTSIKFQQGNIKKFDLPDSSVDIVISRFVYEHNPGEQAFREITLEAFRVLRPNGVYYVIDADGILKNIKSNNTEFNLLTDKLLNGVKDVFDASACQKLPKFLNEAGFEFKTPRHIPMIFFEGSDLEYEDELWRIRFSFLRPRMKEILAEKSEWYEQEFFKALWARESLHYYNRFVFKAVKAQRD